MQAAIIGEEYEACEELVKAHPDFAAALARRGITDQTLVCVDPIPAGTQVPEELAGRRICRGLVWMRPAPGVNPYGRPIEGIVALVDLNRREVIRIDDYGVRPIPAERGEYRTGMTGPEREGVKPIEIVQPEGASFAVDGNLITWQGWSFRAGWTMREGLVLHDARLRRQAGERRSILHRASVCEMAVPYGDPSPSRYIQCPFDIGENLIGSFANALELGCDCLGLIHYFDAVVCNGEGEPITLPNAICLHEEDAGLLWKHWDFRTGDTEVRRARRLVISFITTIGNYDYGFYWMLSLDGTIELEIKLTGIVATGAIESGEQPGHGTLIAEDLYAMNHQHFFNARLDFDLDGERNAVYEVHTEASPPGPGNPIGSAFAGVRTLLESEAQSPQLIDPLSSRGWVVVNHERTNAVGAPVGYRLVPGENCLPYVQADSSFAQARAASRSSTCGSRASTPTSATPPASTPTCTRAARACPSSSPTTRASSTRTSCSGTRSATTTCRAPRTGRSCRSGRWASCSSRAASSTAIRRSTCRRRARATPAVTGTRDSKRARAARGRPARAPERARRPGLRRRARGLERRHRPPSRARRAVRGRRRRRALRAHRARARPAARRARRGPQRGRLRHLRRRARVRPRRAARRARRSLAAQRDGAGRRDVGRLRRRDPGLRARHDRRGRRLDRRRRASRSAAASAGSSATTA